MKAADKALQQDKLQAEIDERGRRENAAARARALAERKADSMPVVHGFDGPRLERHVDAEMIDPAPTGGIVEVFQQRYLLRLIVGRQLAQQYAASVLGLLWSYIQPGMRFLVYFFIFGVVLKTHQGTPNFALRLFTGMVFMHFFTETWTKATQSIWSNRALVLKMRMPREVFPLASMLTALYHTGPQIVILVVTAAIVGWHFSMTAIAAGVLGLLILLAFSTAMALLFSALNVLYKDFQNIVATIVQFMHFLVPMMYSYQVIHNLGEDHQAVYQLYMANPLAEAVLLMQRCFWLPSVHNPSAYSDMFPADLWERGLIMLVLCLGLLFLSQKFFSRVESKFPERL
ncbi:MAG TPA: ABC transporter permease [Marmoricola sp.]|jgi:ABC-2 type transport system permease protein|nr:ABC transporter permease [Marmoricola sp.]